MRLLIIILLLITNDTIYAQDVWHHLDRVEGLTLHHIDEVDDGCWPRPNATEEAAELILRSAGIDLDSNVYKPHWITIFAIGQELNYSNGRGTGACAVTIRVKLDRVEDLAKYKENEVVIYGERIYALTGNKEGMQSLITSSVKELITNFSNSLLKAGYK